MNFVRVDCTKLRNWLETKRAEWIAENITLSELLLIKRRIYQCSPKVYSRLTKLFSFLENKIARRQ